MSSFLVDFRSVNVFFFFGGGGVMLHRFPEVGSREQIFLVKEGSWEQKLGKFASWELKFGSSTRLKMQNLKELKLGVYE